MGFNTSSQNVDTPWLKDDTADVAIASDYWDNPAASDELGKELKDTFHEVCSYRITEVPRPLQIRCGASMTMTGSTKL